MVSALLGDAAAEAVAPHELIRFEVPKTPIKGLRRSLRGIRGEIDGIDSDLLDSLTVTLADVRPHQVLVDGSNLGLIARHVKEVAPYATVFTFLHNVESRFFLGALRTRKRPRALATLVANLMAERAAIRYSDRLICLSGRDSRLLARLYRRPADIVVPLAIPDTYVPGVEAPAEAPDRYMLFVGGSFYANVEGARWFATRVAPKVDHHLVIVGKGMEALRDELATQHNITVIGGVDDVAPWYAGADFVIAPIFDGSGMKTKVAEALMHGKSVVGTPESFVGYEVVQADAGYLCTNAASFAAAVTRFARDPPQRFQPQLRELYLASHSPRAAVEHLRGALRVTPTPSVGAVL